MSRHKSIKTIRVPSEDTGLGYIIVNHNSPEGLAFIAECVQAARTETEGPDVPAEDDRAAEGQPEANSAPDVTLLPAPAGKAKKRTR
jgi:hypothetical protein